MFSLIIVIIFSIILCDLIICRICCQVQGKRNPIAHGDPNVSDVMNKRTSILVKIGRILCVFEILRLNLFLVSYIPSISLRHFLYRFIFMVKLAPSAIIHYGVEIRAPYHLEVGDGSVIAEHCILDARSGLKIGKNVQFSTGAWIWTLQHGVNNEDFSCVGEGKPVVIEDRAWISCRTVILPGVTIREGAVIAAGAIVTKDVEPFSISAGVPAKKIGERNRNLTYELGWQHCHFL